MDTVSSQKREVALIYYKQKKASLGYCAQIADMPKLDFIRYLGENGISIFQYDDEQEFLEELDIPNNVTAAATHEGRQSASDTNVKGYTNMEDLTGSLDE